MTKYDPGALFVCVSYTGGFLLWVSEASGWKRKNVQVQSNLAPLKADLEIVRPEALQQAVWSTLRPILFFLCIC